MSEKSVLLLFVTSATWCYRYPSSWNSLYFHFHYWGIFTLWSPVPHVV